jgi:hypothetical protein
VHPQTVIGPSFVCITTQYSTAAASPSTSGSANHVSAGPISSAKQSAT